MLKFTEVDPSNGARASRTGTGFIVSDSGVVLTAYHVVQAWVDQAAAKKDPDGEKARNPLLAYISSRDAATPISADLIEGNASSDIAVLRLRSPGPYKFISLCFTDKMSSGEKVEVYGFPLGSDFTPYVGTLSNDNAPEGRWNANLSFETGVSGGPVLDIETGQVIGIVKGGLVRQLVVGNSTANAPSIPVPSVNYVTPVIRAHSLLANVGVQSSCGLAQPLQPASTEKDEALRQLEELYDRMALLSKASDPPSPPFVVSELSRRYEGQESSHIGTDASGRYYYGSFRIQDGPNMKEFLAYLARKKPVYASRLFGAGGMDGASLHSQAFVREWRALASMPDFEQLQADFIYRVDYRRLSDRVKHPPDPTDSKRSGLGLDLAKRSLALQAVFYSIAVQYGPRTSLPFDALEPLMPLDGVSDETLIRQLYKSRDNADFYFPALVRSVTGDQFNTLIRQRNSLELRDALYILQHS